MPQLDPTSFATQLFWLAVVFVVLLIMMSRIGLPRVHAAIGTRAAKIDGDLAAAVAARERSAALVADYEASITEARTTAQSMIRAMAETMAKEQAHRENELLRKLSNEARSAEARIAEAKSAALASVEQIAVEAAQAATARLIGERPPPADIRAAVMNVLAEGSR